MNRTFASCCALGLLTAGWASSAAHAQFFCSRTTVFDFSNLPLLPYGGEYLGASTFVGEVTGTTVRVRFSTAGEFDAANIGFSLHFPTFGGAHGFEGWLLGWSGQGEFEAEMQTDGFNGLVGSDEAGLWYWYAEIVNLNPAGGPIEGNFDLLTYTFQFARCRRGDLNCDGTIDFFDIDPFLLALFDADAYAVLHPECDRTLADVNNDTVVDFFDIDAFVAVLIP